MGADARGGRGDGFRRAGFFPGEAIDVDERAGLVVRGRASFDRRRRVVVGVVAVIDVDVVVCAGGVAVGTGGGIALAWARRKAMRNQARPSRDACG